MFTSNNQKQGEGYEKQNNKYNKNVTSGDGGSVCITVSCC